LVGVVVCGNCEFEVAVEHSDQTEKSKKKSVRKTKAEQEQENVQSQLQHLIEDGKNLDKFMADDDGNMITVRDREMKRLLRIRDKSGRQVPFVPNEARSYFAKRWGRKNIILKARQLGMTTYVAARFFIETVTRPGTLTVLVAHDQRSAEDIFRIVHRFQENLPEELKHGALKTSRANVRQTGVAGIG
jgi:uncharacterized Zn finger protein (UPF0148 family)